MPLREYQSLAIDRIRAELRAGRKRVLLISPTGSGKSLLIASMVSSALAKGRSSLFIVHRRELVTQISERLTRDGVPHGIMMGKDSRGHGERVQVCSIQTLSRREHPPADLLLVDEAHRAVGATYLRVFAAYPDAPVIGYTASPWRTTGRGLGDLFESAVVAASPAELIRDGFLCGYDGFAYRAPDLAGVRTVAGDYDERGLTLAYQKSAIYGDVVERWLARAGGRQTIAFASSIEASQELVARFQAAGVAAAHIDYKSPPDDRARILASIRDGSLTLVSNVNLLSEGTDLPTLSVAILARPTKSITVHLQQLGRIMRPKPDGSRALILDHAGNCVRHGLPDAPRDYSLTTTKPREVVPALRTCKFCYAIWEPPRATCPQCGQAPALVEREGPEQVDGVEVDIRATGSDRDAFKRALVAEALARGYAPGWAVHRFLEKFPGSPKPWGMYREIKKAGADGKEGWRA